MPYDKRMTHRPRAITMWDFSWLERRWAGAGYEDWDVALAQLTERGYDAVRIDAYPHLIATDPGKTWTLKPQWNQHSWGAQSMIDVRIAPALPDFIAACGRHGVGVELSTWFRQDLDDVRLTLTTPEALAQAWLATLRLLERAGALEHVIAVDLCNEFPMPMWAPFLSGSAEGNPLPVHDPRIAAWMTASVQAVREEFPGLPIGYSFIESIATLQAADVSALDFADTHLWMAATNDYYSKVGYAFEQFDPIGYDNVVRNGRRVYESDRERYDQDIFDQIDTAAAWSRTAGIPLFTTECWSIIDYKDWPGLDWDWVKDLNERALRRAAATGRWAALASSNFCGPQFVENWRDVAYHRRLTDVIRAARVDSDLTPVAAVEATA
jgi:hypothetical protein